MSIFPFVPSFYILPLFHTKLCRFYTTIHHLISNTLIILGNLSTSNDPSTTSSKPHQFSLQKHYYYSLISLKDDIKYYDYKRQNNKFNVQNILSPHFSPKLGGWFFVGLGGKYHPLLFYSSLISIAPNNKKLSFFISLIFFPTKLNINLVVMHSDQL